MTTKIQEGALMFLQSSSCYRGDVCGSLPCACAETIAKFAEGQLSFTPSAECAHAPDPACRQDSEGSRSIRLGATEIAADLVEAWRAEFHVDLLSSHNTDAVLGELTRRIATALIGEPVTATDADLALADRYADEIIELRKDNEQLSALILELNRRLVLAGVDPRADAEPNLLGGPHLAAPETTPNSGFDSRDVGHTRANTLLKD